MDVDKKQDAIAFCFSATPHRACVGEAPKGPSSMLPQVPLKKAGKHDEISEVNDVNELPVVNGLNDDTNETIEQSKQVA